MNEIFQCSKNALHSDLRKQRVKAVIYFRTLDILGAEDASCYINVAILFKFASTEYKGVEIIQCRTT